ncbi:MAG: hypothetical protein FWD89_00090 [Firmicutes bacterium]|nr:hypothetical protein [Bacillota bacterium]
MTTPFGVEATKEMYGFEALGKAIESKEIAVKDLPKMLDKILMAADLEGLDAFENFIVETITPYRKRKDSGYDNEAGIMYDKTFLETEYEEAQKKLLADVTLRKKLLEMEMEKRYSSIQERLEQKAKQAERFMR